ncbi:hypothetical protein [Sulfurospirillum sp. 1612]|uniref:hypothetical protein n=1 Tax=Sulfurospirillum sp. 1612 TaxID=3094835 RepID=UPI002F9331EA
MTTAYQDAPGGYYQGGNGWGTSGYGGGGYGNSSMANMGGIVSAWGGKGLASSYSSRGANDTDKAIASGGGALAAAGAVKSMGLMAIGKSMSVLGISAIPAPLIGVAGIAAVGAITSIAIAKNAPAISKGLQKAGSFAFKQTGKMLSQSSQSLVHTYQTYNSNSPTKSEHLDGVSKMAQQREEKFKGFVKEARNKMKDGQEIRGDLKQMHNLKLPTAQAKLELHKLTTDYLVKNNLKDGKLDTTSLHQDLKKFGEEIGLGKDGFKELKAGVNNRLEEHKDNFVLDKKDNRVQLQKPSKEVAKEKAEKTKVQGNKKLEEIQQKQESKKQEQQKDIPAKERLQEQGKEHRQEGNVHGG